MDLWNAEFYAGVGTKLKQVIENTPGTLFDRAEFLKIAITLPNSIETNRPGLKDMLLEKK